MLIITSSVILHTLDSVHCKVTAHTGWSEVAAPRYWTVLPSVVWLDGNVFLWEEVWRKGVLQNEFLTHFLCVVLIIWRGALISQWRGSQDRSESFDSVPLKQRRWDNESTNGSRNKREPEQTARHPGFKTRQKQNKMCLGRYLKWAQIAGPWLKCHCFSPTIRTVRFCFQSLSSWRMNRWLWLLCPTSKQCLIMKLGEEGRDKNVTRRLPA